MKEQISGFKQHLIAEKANNAACTEDGTKTAVCDNGCGKRDTRADTGSALGHDMSPWERAALPGSSDKAVLRRECNRCGYAETMEISEDAVPQTGEGNKLWPWMALMIAAMGAEIFFKFYIAKERKKC